MLYVDAQAVKSADVELVNEFASRHIKYAFHDIDGTHSLIREWVPVMALCNGYVATYGLPDTTDPAELANIIAEHDPAEFPEAHRFAIESAGLSALTQMEWAIRRAIQNKVFALDGVVDAVNDEIVARIWKGEEEFFDLPEAPGLREIFTERSSHLFRAYEILLLQMGRDRNLADAKINPEKWRVPGSMDFLRYLADCGVKNYFVTGAVVEYGDNGEVFGTMVEEVRALGFGIGPGGVVEKLIGSAWGEKLPKDRIMENLLVKENIDPASVLVIGDGRSEISAGAKMKALTVSRLPQSATRQREIHRELGTHIILEQYDLNELKKFMRPE